MANNFNTLAGTLVLQETLSTLLVKFPWLMDISTDFSNKQAKFNQTVDSRVVIPRVAVAFDPAVGYVESDATTIDVPITITGHIHHTFAVTDVEQSKTNRKLRDELTTTAAHAIGTKLTNDFFGTVLAATYPLSYERAAVDFSRDDLTKIGTKLDKAFVPDINRFAVLDADYSEGILLDSTMVANPNQSNSDITTTGKLPRMIQGFAASKFASMQDNGENLHGIAGNREAVIMNSACPKFRRTPPKFPAASKP